MRSQKYASTWTVTSRIKPSQVFRVMSPILRNFRAFFSGTFLLSSFIISSSHDRRIPSSGWACHCSTLIRACVMPNLLGLLSRYWSAQERLQDRLIKLLPRHGKKLFFRLSVKHALWCWYSVLWDTQSLLLIVLVLQRLCVSVMICKLWDSSVNKSSKARGIFHLLFCKSSDHYREKGLCTESKVGTFMTAQQTPFF